MNSSNRLVATLLLAVVLASATATRDSTAAVLTTQEGPEPFAGLGIRSEAGEADAAGATGREALAAVSRGRWSSGCAIATRATARGTSDIDALGLFGMCSALLKDVPAVERAVARLGKIENPPRYLPMVNGIQHLQAKRPQSAEASFRSVMLSDPNDPLANYFLGEALYSRGRTADAVAAFRAVTMKWPEHTPAMTAIARVLSGPNASPADLTEAISFAERATRIDPTNRAQWKLLADLCRRGGQGARADAIELQWLRTPALKP